MIPVYYHPGYAAPIGDDHRMPIRKFGLVAEILKRDPAAEFHVPELISREALERVHTQKYIRAIETGEPRDLAEGQKFSWSPQLFPAVCLTSGGLLAAARHALRHGVACALVSGFHHACADHGEGFCTFNGLVITLDVLYHEGRIRHGFILDMDLHYGNGTASLAPDRPHITTVSIYGNDYWQNQAYKDVETIRHADGKNHFSAILSNGTNECGMMEVLEKTLPLLLSRGKPDLLIYQAGADPYWEDPYSPLALDHPALKNRDRRVFQFCKDHSIPIVWVLAGGYTEDISKVVKVHVNTFEACKEVFAPMNKTCQLSSPGNLNLKLECIEPTPIEPAIAAATASWRAWARLSYKERITHLQAAEADLREMSETLAMGISLETGKPLTEARGEMAAVLGKFSLTFEDAERYLSDEAVTCGPHPAEIRQRPRGPAVVIGPFNFPLHLANGAILPHLVAGNTVIFKPSPIGAIVAKSYAEVFEKYLPKGVFQLVQGGAEEGLALCTDARVRAICFTGSVEVGRAIAITVAGDFSKSLALEMGGKNALLLLEDGNAAAAAKAAALGICATAGQRCNSTSRAIIHTSQFAQFCDALKKELQHYQPGDPCLETTTLGTLGNEAAHQRYAAALESGGEWLVKGAAMDHCNGLPGYYVKPAARVWKTFEMGMKCPHLAIELFGPLIDVFCAQNDEEMLALHNATPFGLTASIFTASRQRFDAIGSELQVGNLYANLPSTFSPSTLPFGGCGLSGNGKPAGRGFVRFATDEQAVQYGEGDCIPFL